jgi:hypothetical protein
MEAKLIISAFDHTKSALTSVSNNIKIVGKTASTAGKDLSELGKKVGQLGAKLAALTAGAAFAFKKLFVDVAIEAENCSLLLNNALGKDLGAEALKGVKHFAAENGRTLAEVTEAWLALKTGGIKPTEESLKTLSGMAAGHGKSMAEVAKAFQGALKGQAGGLDEFGVKSEQVGKRLLFSYKDQAGKLVNLAAKTNDPESLNKALAQIAKDKAGGAEESRSQSFGGMLAKLTSGWAAFRVAVMDSGPFAFLKGELNSVLEWVQKLRETGKLDELAKAWGGKLTEGLKKLKEGLVKAWEWLKKYAPMAKEIFERFGGFKTVAIAVGAILAGPVVGAFGKAAKSVTLLGRAIAFTPLGIILAAGAGIVALMNHVGALQPFIDGLCSGFEIMKGVLGEAFQGLLKSLSGLFGEISLNLVDANGNINPQAWSEFGEKIAIICGGALKDMVDMLSTIVNLLVEVGKGLGSVLGEAVYGDINKQTEALLKQGDAEKKFKKAIDAGDAEGSARAQLESQHWGRVANDTAGNTEWDEARGIAIDKSTTGGRFQGAGQQSLLERRRQVAQSEQSQLAAQFTKAFNDREAQKVETKVEVKLTGTLPDGFNATASSSDSNTTTSDRTKQNMGWNPL